jgi:hypothetical protein
MPFAYTAQILPDYTPALVKNNPFSFSAATGGANRILRTGPVGVYQRKVFAVLPVWLRVIYANGAGLFSG